MLQSTDEELFASARAGGPDGTRYLNELFRRHQTRVILWCLRFTGDREAAADLAQEIFIRVQKGMHTWNGEARFTTWLYTICRNHCRSEWRSRGVAPEPLPDDNTGGMVDASVGDFDDALDREQRLTLARGWINNVLDDTERQVFTLHYSEELPLDSITRMLGLENASGAKAYIVSARRKLHEVVRRWRAQ